MRRFIGYASGSFSGFPFVLDLPQSCVVAGYGKVGKALLELSGFEAIVMLIARQQLPNLARTFREQAGDVQRSPAEGGMGVRPAEHSAGQGGELGIGQSR